MVCLRNISVDTLHKGDTEDDDNNNYLTVKQRYDIIMMKFRQFLKKKHNEHYTRCQSFNLE